MPHGISDARLLVLVPADLCSIPRCSSATSPTFPDLRQRRDAIKSTVGSYNTASTCILPEHELRQADRLVIRQEQPPRQARRLDMACEQSTLHAAHEPWSALDDRYMRDFMYCTKIGCLPVT